MRWYQVLVFADQLDCVFYFFTVFQNAACKFNQSLAHCSVLVQRRRGTQSLVSSMAANIQRPALTSHLVVHRFDRVLSLRSLLNPVADASVQRVHGKTDQTYKPRSAKNQAAKSHYKWKSMEVQCRARTETECRSRIVQFASKERILEDLWNSADLF